MAARAGTETGRRAKKAGARLDTGLRSDLPLDDLRTPAPNASRSSRIGRHYPIRPDLSLPGGNNSTRLGPTILGARSRTLFGQINNKLVVNLVATPQGVKPCGSLVVSYRPYRCDPPPGAAGGGGGKKKERK